MKRWACLLLGHEFYHLDAWHESHCRRCGKRNDRWFAMQEHLRAIRECGHANRRDNPAATEVLDRNPQVCLDCGTGLVGPKP